LAVVAAAGTIRPPTGIVRRNAIPEPSLSEQVEQKVLADAKKRGLVPADATTDALRQPMVMTKLVQAWHQEWVHEQVQQAEQRKQDGPTISAADPGAPIDEIRSRTMAEGADYDGELLSDSQLRQRNQVRDSLRALEEISSNPLSAIGALTATPEAMNERAHQGAAWWGLLSGGAMLANPTPVYEPAPVEKQDRPVIEGPAVAGSGKQRSSTALTPRSGPAVEPAPESTLTPTGQRSETDPLPVIPAAAPTGTAGGGTTGGGKGGGTTARISRGAFPARQKKPQVRDPFSGEELGVQSASAATARSTVTGIRADVGEKDAWLAALKRGEIGLQAPMGSNATGADFITAVVEGSGVVTVVVTDVKSSVKGRFPKPETGMPNTWMTEVRDATAKGVLDLGDPALEDAIRDAVGQGRVRLRQINVDYTDASGKADKMIKGF
jgi:hypothetical protein